MIKHNFKNMNLITIIAVIIIVIILFFSIIYIDKNNKVIEKFNSANTKQIKANYLDTNGNLPVEHKSPDNQKDIRYPTLNIIKKSTVTFRPCQIHFNNDGTSKYIYEDEWKEIDTLTSSEDNSVYNIPFKKFGVNNNNVDEIQNFNETTKCFKEKNSIINLNTYKYKSNDLINYKTDTYIDVDFIENNNNYKKSFMQMNFNKHSNENSFRKYNDDVIDSICSYNYETDLSLGNIKLYRLTIIPPVENNKNKIFDPTTINDGIITAIDHISIDQKNNSTFIVDDYNKVTINKFADLLSGEIISYYSIENGIAIYKIEKKTASEEETKGLNVKIYKFNRNYLCNNPVIRSYEISNAIRLKTHLIIKSIPYNSPSINLQNTIPVHANLSDAENKILINADKSSRHMINGITEDIVTKSLNIVIKNRYNTKEELLSDIKYFIYKIIIISNKNLVTRAVDLIIKYDNLENQKRLFLESFNTIQKFITIYSRKTITDKVRKDLLNEIIAKKNIAFNEIYIHKFRNLPQLNYEYPFTINYANSGDYETKHYYSNNNFYVAQDTICNIRIVGGGGGGAGDSGPAGESGQVVQLNNINVTAGYHSIVVGNGGAGGDMWPSNSRNYSGGRGGNSSFGTYVAQGGAGGVGSHRSGNNNYGGYHGSGGRGGWCGRYGGSRGIEGLVSVTYRKITITNNKGNLHISNTNSNVDGSPIKIIMKKKDVNAVINNNKVTLYKNKTYIVDYFSNQTRLREEVEAEKFVTEQTRTRTIPPVYSTVATVQSNNIKITYEIEDENVINFNNARDNKETETILPERIRSVNSENIYKIATKNQPYLKVGIIIRNVRNANEQKLGIIFQTNINGGTELKQGKDYHIIVQSENSNNAEDIIITGYSIIFPMHVSGDIFMKILNISSIFIYDYTLDPTANFIDIESDYINGRNKSSSLLTIISNNESAINNYYGLYEFNRERKILYDNRTFFTEDKVTNVLSIEGNPNDNNGNILTKLQNIYNSILSFDESNSSRKPNFTFSNNVKISDCIPNFNIDKITYEDPKENKALTYESSYNLQQISNNYVYFRYPYQ
jgi:hypothetical protein